MAAKSVTDSSVVPSNKGGYDYEFVSPPPKSLECPVCLLTLRDPHVVSCCGNEFCQVCIKRVQGDGKPCPLCNEQSFSTMLHKKLVREVNALVVRCPQKEMGCDWEGELGQLHSHLNPEIGSISGCGYIIVACSYECGVQLQRQKIHEHELEICPKRPIEMQVACLLKKYEAIDTENRLLRQELGVIKEAHEKEIKEMKSIYETEINQLKQELDEIKSEACDKLKAKQEAMKFKVEENSSTLKRLEEKCNRLQDNKTPLSLPPYYFEVLNVDRYLEPNMDFVSAPFYSHPGGYKMDISVYSNVERGGHSKGSYLSLYVSILHGEFDDHLKWPFDGEVTVQVYNRTQEKWSIETKIELNKECGLDVVERQVDLLSSARWGCPKWLSHSDLKVNFVKDTNTLRFRVVSVKVNSI